MCLPLTPLPPACSSCVYAACPGARLPFRVHLHLHLNRGTPRTSVCLPPLPCSAFGFQYLQGSRGGGNCCAFIPLRGWLPFACGCPASPRAPVASSLLSCCPGRARIHHPLVIAACPYLAVPCRVCCVFRVLHCRRFFPPLVQTPASLCSCSSHGRVCRRVYCLPLAPALRASSSRLPCV